MIPQKSNKERLAESFRNIHTMSLTVDTELSWERTVCPEVTVNMLDPDHNSSKFLNELTDAGKNYSSPAEETRRRAIFEKNAKLIAAHNFFYAVGMSSYFMDVNQFSDMTSEEWLTLYASPLPDYVNTGNESTFLPPDNFIAAPAVDWRKKGYVTPVKNQGSCGSCWAFSSQLVDCSHSNKGCNGGLMNLAFDYIKHAGGIEGESDYPYRGRDLSCQFIKSKVKATVTGSTTVPTGSESSLQAAVASVGPVSVAIHVTSSFQHYSGGVFTDPTCSPSKLNHGVLVVGYGSSSSDYWLVKNSWGKAWGQEGYIWMARNKGNMCGIASFAIYPLV
ncbi:CATL-like protein [Mya arenaria]|uniref:CATL-like protein n=1 Tax=Mya arenaria TaxID=6604 RepID=A0ABY7FS23_MYAAR|nr:CATL-like protein [Mya arenaria]